MKSKMKYHLYWQCPYSNTGDTIGKYRSLKEAVNVFFSVIRENPHVHYYLDKDGKEIKCYAPDDY